MGPRALARGNLRRRGHQTELEELQWGRALSRAEMRKSSSTLSCANALQWGRALSRAEMNREAGIGNPLPALQWGRALSRAEIAPAGVRLTGRFRASMGPRALAR